MAPHGKPWLDHYPAGVPAGIDTARYRSLVELLDDSFGRHADRTAYRFMGRSYSYAEVDRLSRDFASFLLAKGLSKGDRVAVMMPNVPQYPVVAAGILRAGMVVVNVNPLYTARELAHQMQDCGARLIVVLENFAHVLQEARAADRAHGGHVVLASVGDMLGPLKGSLVNLVLRRIKGAVPRFELPGATRFDDALRTGRNRALRAAPVGADDVAVLQYTGGTTGVSKGATLLHRNLVANVLQSEAWYGPALKLIPPGTQPGLVCALPLYHVYAFSVIMLVGLFIGGRVILVPNPRDIKGTLRTLAREAFHVFPAVNTLFNVLARDPRFGTVAWGDLKLSLSAGMATQKATAELWQQRTGCAICEGYGLSETSPLATCNPIDTQAFTGGIGMPVPHTEVRLLSDDGREVPPGEPGEIAIRGPQVMAGYWGRPEETRKAFTEDGFFLSGDIGVMDERGYLRIVDRKKDMILVSGFNVYPHEIEDVVAQMPGVAECAAIGVEDARSGEAVKVFIVCGDGDGASEDAVRAWCEARLAAYKRPRHIAFVPDLPKSPVGKILRRQLRG